MSDDYCQQEDCLFNHRGDENHLVREIGRTHQVLLSCFAREVGVPAARFTLMAVMLKRHPRESGVMELARELGVNPAAVTRQIKEMEQEGLVERRPDPKDGRRVWVRLSAQGLSEFEGLHQRSHDLERSLESLVGPQDIAATLRVLAALRGVLEAPASGGQEPPADGI